VAGKDGSLADRFANLDSRAHVYAKTGSLGGVKTLSGFATTVSGKSVAFSILSNNFNLPTKRMTDTIDNIVENVVDDGRARNK
jgi:D-alanyl-D-alanine carboxypeptidase/D-alanyl-D-alanine-endopeptidase (penicillin-binding protein 4)